MSGAPHPDETSRTREMFTLLRAGRIEAATEVFEQYMQSRINVGDADGLRTMWAHLVSERKKELALAAADEAARRQQRRLFGVRLFG